MRRLPGSGLRRADRYQIAAAIVVVAGLVGGAAGAAVIVRRPPPPSMFSGAPSVQQLDLPAGAAPPALSTQAEPPRPTPSPEPSSATDALRRFLAAERDGALETSRSLLSADAHERFPTGSAWARDQIERLLPTSFEIAPDPRPATDPARVGFLVRATHTGSLDVFRGLVPARSIQYWTVLREGATWRVPPRPNAVEPVLPDRDEAPAVVQAWLDRLAACRADDARSLELAPRLLGVRGLRALPCSTKGRWEARAPEPLDRAPNAATFLAAFGVGAATWSLSVPVSGPEPFTVIVAPVGEAWRVIGLGPPRTGGGEATT